MHRLLVACLTLLCALPTLAQNGVRPNIVFIFADETSINITPRRGTNDCALDHDEAPVGSVGLGTAEESGELPGSSPGGTAAGSTPASVAAWATSPSSAASATAPTSTPGKAGVESNGRPALSAAPACDLVLLYPSETLVAWFESLSEVQGLGVVLLAQDLDLIQLFGDSFNTLCANFHATKAEGLIWPDLRRRDGRTPTARRVADDGCRRRAICGSAGLGRDDGR